MNKKAQGLSITTIILIILGVAVLVVLILGFALGWDKILPWISPSNNVNQVVQQCVTACSTGDNYGYCYAAKTVKVESGEIKYVTCNDLANNKESWGFTKCSSINCQLKIEDYGSLCDNACQAKNKESYCTIKRSYISKADNTLSITTCIESFGAQKPCPSITC